MAKGVVYKPFHNSKDPNPTPPPVPPKIPSRRRSLSNRARQLLGIGSGDGAAGRRRSVDGIGNNMRRIWSRSGSTPPDTRNRDHRPQDGDRIFSPVSAYPSRAYAEERAKTMFKSNRNKVHIQAHFRASSMGDLSSGGPLREDNRGRSRRSTTAMRSAPVPPAPPPKPWVLTTGPPSSTTTKSSQATTPGTVPKKSAGTQNNRSPNQTCRTPGCAVLVCVRQNGVASRYCSDAHKELGKRGCILCRGAPTKGIVAFCRDCYDGILPRAPVLVEVPEDHERHKSVKLQFQEAWLHNDKCPEVRAIYKVVSARENDVRYHRYLDRVEMQRNFALEGEYRGNECSRWHGTTRKCKIGDKGTTRFCSDTSCSLCCIMKTSFDLKFFGKKTNFGRFGIGIYTTATSSKSDSYSHNDCASKWKAVLLNKVVVGRGYSLKINDTTLTGPPAGYDSVIGEVGVKLNYDEVVVYDNDAIRPSYLVMYDMPK